MPINTKSDYIQLSPTSNFSSGDVLRLPAPTDMSFSNQHLENAERNPATGTMLMQIIGRTQYKQPLTFTKLKNRQFWELNRWLDRYGYQFYCRYFSHTEGRIKIQRFYSGSMQDAKPSKTTEIIQGICVPKFYKDVTLTIIDMGEATVITERELPV